jgi:hypothetical protein
MSDEYGFFGEIFRKNVRGKKQDQTSMIGSRFACDSFVLPDEGRLGDFFFGK